MTEDDIKELDELPIIEFILKLLESRELEKSVTESEEQYKGRR